MKRLAYLKIVLERGLEPPPLARDDFESSAYTIPPLEHRMYITQISSKLQLYEYFMFYFIISGSDSSLIPNFL